MFLIGYRRTFMEDICSSIAGIAAVAVVLFPTSLPGPATEPAWISYVHHSAAALFIFILGVFCCVFFLEKAGQAPLHSFRALLATALRPSGLHQRFYLACGLVIFAAGIAAAVTGIANWGSGLKPTPLYICEGLSVLAFGSPWIDKALYDPQQGRYAVRFRA